MDRETERFKKMVQSSQDVFWEFDENANFTYVSKGIRNLLGYDPEELIGLNAFDLMNADEAARVHSHFDPIAKRFQPFNNLENTNIHKDGHEVVVESSGTPIFSKDGQFRGYRGVDRDITMRKQTESLLRESEERFRYIAEMLPEIVFELDLQGQITFASRRAFDLFGYSQEDFGRGMNAFDMVVPWEREIAMVRSQKRLAGEMSGAVEYTALAKDGSTFPVILNMEPIFKAGKPVGFVGVMTDITQRKLTEETLRKNQQLLIETQQMAKLGSWVFDADTNLAKWTEETYRIFGVTPETFIPSYVTFLNTVHPDDRALVEKTYSRSLKDHQKTFEVEHRIIRGDTGEIRHVHLKCRHDFYPDGSRSKTFGMVQDITERKKNELALQLATKSAESANQAKSVFLAKVSHEFRTPLTAIIGFGELMEGAKLTAPLRKYLGAINTASQTLSNLINDILDLSKIEAGELKIKQGAFNLRDLISHIAGLQKRAIQNKSLSLHVKVAADVPDLVYGDKLRIEQLLTNLMDNAIRFTERGGVTVFVSLPEKSLGIDLLEVAVKDTGVGIPKMFFEDIFQPFFQVHKAERPIKHGCGLGLTISRSLASLMGGSLGVESEEGVGSTFRLLLPLKGAMSTTKDENTSSDQPFIWEGPAMRVLLAEDNPLNITLIKNILEDMGHAVTIAENGLDALDILNMQTFDLVLMDIQMPLINGVDVLQTLRGSEKFTGKHLKVIALTAFALIGDKERYLNLGFDGYVSKPFMAKQLLGEIVRVVSG